MLGKSVDRLEYRQQGRFIDNADTLGDSIGRLGDIMDNLTDSMDRLGDCVNRLGDFIRKLTDSRGRLVDC